VLRVKYPLQSSTKKIYLTSKNTSNSCPDYVDSTTIYLRDPTAIISFGTTFCKKTASVGNPYPYTLSQSSLDNDYFCSYNNTFFFTDLQGRTIQRPITFGTSFVKANFVKDTFVLGLIARDINGCADTARQTVYISKPTANFTYAGSFNPSKLCSKKDILTLTDLSQSPAGIKTREWRLYWKDSLNPFATSSLKNPAIPINFTKKFKGDSILVILKVTDSIMGCDGNFDSVIKKIAVVNPQDSIVSIDSICFGSSISLRAFNPQPNFNRTWWHSGSLLPGTNSTSLTITTSPRDTVQLIYTDPTVNCSDTVIKELMVSNKMRLGYTNSNASKPYLCFPTDASSTIKVVDSNNTQLRCIWKINNNPHTTQSNPNTFPLDPGPNVTYLWVRNSFGCLDSMRFYDTVIKPDAIFTVDHPKICKGGTIQLAASNLSFVDSLIWDLGNGVLDTSNRNPISYTYTQAPIADSTLISLILFGPKGHCRKAISQPIYIYEAKANFVRNHGLDTAICMAPFWFKNTSTKGDQFQWRFGDGLTSNVKDSVVHSYALPGSYSVTLISIRDSLGCKDSITKKIGLFPYPKLMVRLDTVCFGDSSTIIASDTSTGTKLFVSPKINRKDTLVSPLKFIQNQDTTYKIIAVNRYGCLDSVLKIASIIKPQHFVPNDTLDTIVAQGSRVTLPYIYQSSNTIVWTPLDDSFSCQKCSNPSYQVSSKKTFQVRISDYKNCFTTYTYYFLDVYPDILIKVPDAFTPNGDGNNDMLFAKGFGIKRLIYFRVFNRMGQMLFESHDESNGWDGHYKDQLQNSDAYFYTAEGEGYNGKNITVEGAFMLLK
jgi:gliding motility-associated-like protein